MNTYIVCLVHLSGLSRSLCCLDFGAGCGCATHHYAIPGGGGMSHVHRHAQLRATVVCKLSVCRRGWQPRQCCDGRYDKVGDLGGGCRSEVTVSGDPCQRQDGDQAAGLAQGNVGVQPTSPQAVYHRWGALISMTRVVWGVHHQCGSCRCSGHVQEPKD